MKACALTPRKCPEKKTDARELASVFAQEARLKSQHHAMGPGALLKAGWFRP